MSEHHVSVLLELAGTPELGPEAAELLSTHPNGQVRALVLHHPSRVETRRGQRGVLRLGRDVLQDPTGSDRHQCRRTSSRAERSETVTFLEDRPGHLLQDPLDERTGRREELELVEGVLDPSETGSSESHIPRRRAQRRRSARTGERPGTRTCTGHSVPQKSSS